MRIPLTACFLLFLLGCSFAQSELNAKLSRFAEEYKLYNKRLERVEALRENSELEAWNKSLKKWDKAYGRDSFCIQNEFQEYIRLRCPCKTTTNNNCLGVNSYPLEYLLAITDRYEANGKLSKKNAIILKNILTHQVQNQQLIEQDAEFLNFSYADHFENSLISKSLVEQIVKFAIGDVQTIREAKTLISNFKAKEFNELKQFLGDRNMSYSDLLLSLYRRKDKYLNSFSIPSYGGRDPLKERLRTSVAQDFYASHSPEDWILKNLDSLDYVKYDAFFKQPMIFNLAVFKYLFDQWDEYERRRFTQSGTHQYLMDRGLLSDLHKMLAALERHFPDRYFGEDYHLEFKSIIEQLFIAAYNDVYFELGVDQWSGEPEGEIDPRAFDLTEHQHAIIEALLNMDEQVTKSELQRLLMDQNFDDFETEYSFRLACFFAFHQKHEKMNRSWNHSEFYTNPFVSEKKNDLFPIQAIGVDELEKCKQVIQQIVQTEDKDGGKYCFTSYRGSWNASLSPHLSRKHVHSAVMRLSALQAVEMESGFIRFVFEIVPLNESSLNSTSESILIPMPPAPAQGPPSVVFRPKSKQESAIVDNPQVPARFPGGDAAYNVWIQENVQYPALSRELGDQGRVVVKFIVEIDGKLSNIEVMRGGITPELNKEAIRVARTMPRWIPAELNGEKVRTQYILPIDFVLN